MWGTAANVPSGLPSLLYLLFLPACFISLAYIVGALRRVHGGGWWITVFRAVALTGMRLAAETLVLLARRPT